MSFGKKGTPDIIAATPSPSPPAITRTVARPPGLDFLQPPPPPAEVIDAPVTPIVSFGLIAIFTIVYIAEVRWGVGNSGMTPSIMSQVATGGVAWHLVVGQGEWWRLISAAFLHGSLPHLIGNSIALYIVGRALEGLVGRLWFLALFFIGALGGSLMSILVNPAFLVSVGASGAIMALFCACLLCSFRLPPSKFRRRLRQYLAIILVPAFMPLIFGAAKGSNVDYAAHAGGIVAGMLAGFLLFAAWPEDEEHPLFQPLAGIVGAIGGVLSVLALAGVIWKFDDYAVGAQLMPDTAANPARIRTRSDAEDLVRRFPRDPRCRLFYAELLLQARALTEAEAQLRQGLAERQILGLYFRPELEQRIRAVLAATLVRRDPAEAKAVAEPLCAGADGEHRQSVAKLGLCGRS